MAAHGLYLVRMDVAHDHERTFNDVYDKEHVPNLRAVKGVRRASRYRQASATEPRYMAAYELDGLDVLDSAAFKVAGEAGRWPTAVRPHTMNRHLARYEWVGGNAALTGKTPYVFWVMMDVEPHREALGLLGHVQPERLRVELPGRGDVVHREPAERLGRTKHGLSPHWSAIAARCSALSWMICT